MSNFRSIDLCTIRTYVQVREAQRMMGRHGRIPPLCFMAAKNNGLNAWKKYCLKLSYARDTVKLHPCATGSRKPA